MSGSGKFQDHGLQSAARDPQQDPSRARMPVPGLACGRGRWKEARGPESPVFNCHGVYPGQLHVQGHAGPRRHVRRRFIQLAAVVTFHSLLMGMFPSLSAVWVEFQRWVVKESASCCSLESLTSCSPTGRQQSSRGANSQRLDCGRCGLADGECAEIEWVKLR